MGGQQSTAGELISDGQPPEEWRYGALPSEPRLFQKTGDDFGYSRGAVRERVFVRVYDLGKTVLLRGFGMTRTYGAFHTGVEVYGREWSFGMTDGHTTGITWCKPGMHPDHNFRETLAMGCTNFTRAEVFCVIEDMMIDWMGTSYSVLTRNCHHFSDAFCERLGVANLPSWVNDLAGAGAVTAEVAGGVYNGVATGASVAYNSTAYVASAAGNVVMKLNCCSRDRKLMYGGPAAGSMNPAHSLPAPPPAESQLPAAPPVYLDPSASPMQWDAYQQRRRMAGEGTNGHENANAAGFTQDGSPPQNGGNEQQGLGWQPGKKQWWE